MERQEKVGSSGTPSLCAYPRRLTFHSSPRLSSGTQRPTGQTETRVPVFLKYGRPSSTDVEEPVGHEESGSGCPTSCVLGTGYDVKLFLFLFPSVPSQL